jgi:hypothetical protein
MNKFTYGEKKCLKMFFITKLALTIRNKGFQKCKMGIDLIVPSFKKLYFGHFKTEDFFFLNGF